MFKREVKAENEIIIAEQRQENAELRE